MSHEIFQKLELLGLHVKLFSAAPDFTCQKIDFKIGKNQTGLIVGLLSSSEEIFHTSREFLEGKGFYKIIVGAASQSGNALMNSIHCGQEQDWRGNANSTQISQDGKTIKAWEASVEDNTVPRA